MPAPPINLPGRPLAVGDPFCSNCGYALKDLTESARCPECGKPLVEVLVRHAPGGAHTRSVRIKSEVTVFGWPLYHIAFGPRPELGEAKGVAKGVIAIGDVAVGGIAAGGMSFGLISFGGSAIGLCSFGGMAIGALTAAGGGALGGIAIGGGAVGGFATGGGAAGFMAQGGGALGVYARGPGAFGMHTIRIGTGSADPEAVRMFDTFSPIMGGSKGGAAGAGLSMFGAPLASIALVNLLVLLVIGMLVLVGRRGKDDNPYRSTLPTRPG